MSTAPPPEMAPSIASSPLPLTTAPQDKSPRSDAALIPWDPDSPEHHARLQLQRKACGWKYDKSWTDKWAKLQKEGKIALQWVILTDNDVNKEEKLGQHLSAFQDELTPLFDTATTFGGSQRTPTSTPFIPVGHISLDTSYEEPEKVASDNLGEGVYWISTFYISTALQKYGLGRAAMDFVEEMAVNEPLNAKTLALSTARSQPELNRERWAAMKREPPKFTVQDWYARRGFEAYKEKDNMWSEVDESGKTWFIHGIFMKKEIK